MDNNNYDLNWYNYKSFEPKDMSNLNIGYHYDPMNYMNAYSPQSGPNISNRNNLNSNYYSPKKNGSTSSAWGNIKSFLPQNYGEAGALLSGVGSIYGAISGAKAAKDANDIAKDVLEEQRRQDKKRQQEADTLSKTIGDVWGRE